ncbi:MAG: hypothetical protein VYC82_03585, partial [Verrucomicrobiota bacterium]|nr:hypothetical protein [Verrucomicrobiota bacterium]
LSLNSIWILPVNSRMRSPKRLKSSTLLRSEKVGGETAGSPSGMPGHFRLLKKARYEVVIPDFA